VKLVFAILSSDEGVFEISSNVEGASNDPSTFPWSNMELIRTRFTGTVAGPRTMLSS
jgi:hypothetical protein